MAADEPGKRPTDPQLSGVLARAAAGDGVAWHTLVELYSHRVFALARSRVRDVHLAEEITQSVFATIAIKLGSGEYTEQGRFEQWLFRVAMNRVRDSIRRSRRRPDHADAGILESAAAADVESASDAASLAALREAVARLPEADREVIELRHHGGLGFNQIAEMLDEPLGTLLARHHRALKKLKAMIEAGTASAGSARGIPS